MQESFLHFLWQFQNFSHKNLQTTDSQSISIINAGFLNSNAGPDFLNARIIINQIEWIGSVEIHLKSSDWLQHNHQQNLAYENVILHVVWQADKAIHRQDGSIIPTLVLKDLTDDALIKNYNQLIENQDIIPCARQFEGVDSIKKLSMLDKAIMQRLEQKAKIVHEFLEENNQDWEEVTYRLLAKNFGFKLNAEPFLKLAENLPLKILQKHKNNLLQLEALMFGVAGFLEKTEIPDQYWQSLKQEFDFLKAKYQLGNKVLNLHEWKFMRLRPSNFPTVKIAQFAVLIAQESNLFSVFINLNDPKSLQKNLKISQSKYWKEHYVFGKLSDNVPSLGKDAVQNIVINTAVPLLVAYAQNQDNQDFIDKAIGHLENCPAEQNHITTIWKDLGLKISNAFDSQALIQQYNQFCLPKKCLNCTIGVSILRE